MQAGFRDHSGGAPDGLGGKFQGLGPWQSGLDTAVGERLDDHENKGGAAARQAGDGIELSFRYFDRQPHGTEKAAGEVGVGHCRRFAQRESCGALAHEGWGVRHASDHATSGRRVLFQPFDGESGGDGNDKALVIARQGGQSGGGLMGLGAQQDGFAVTQFFERANRLGSGRLPEGLGRCLEGVEADDLSGFERLRANCSRDQGSAHFAASNDSDVHGAESSGSRVACERSFCLVAVPLVPIVPAMRKWFLLLLLLLPNWMLADEAPSSEEAKDDEAVLPAASAIVSELVAKLPAPMMPAVPEGVTMAVTANSETAQRSVRNGMLCLHTGWDFEAYRHFSSALAEDPDCLMAHWGVGLALLHGSEDLAEQREVALVRMLDLVDRGIGTELEKRYVFGLASLLRDGPTEAASAFSAAAEKFPNDPQMGLLKALLGRGGFDVTGDPTPDQERAENDMRKLIERFPELSYLRYALLAMRAEAPSLEGDLEMARELCTEASGYAPYFHLLGHYEWRCGNHSRAGEAFGRASDLYSEWMKAANLTALHCAPWTKAECYRAVALASKGEYDSALAAAMAVASIEVPIEEVNSSGGRMLMWEGKTLPARILMRRGRKGDMKIALDALPKLEELEGVGKKSLVLWSFQAHSSITTARLLLEKGEADDVLLVSQDVTRLGENFVKTRDVAVGMGERSEWLRTFKNFEVMASELRGLITMSRPKADRGGAFNWYRSAIDRQSRMTLMMPPGVLLPMEARLGEYYVDRGEADQAIETLQQGLEKWPNDLELLTRLKGAFQASGSEEKAKETEQAIKELEAQ